MKSWRQNIQDDEGDWSRGVWPSPGAEDSVRLDQGGGCSQVYKKQEMNFSFPGPKTENFTPTLPNN
jgi:hypothetical protein